MRTYYHYIISLLEMKNSINGVPTNTIRWPNSVDETSLHIRDVWARYVKKGPAIPHVFAAVCPCSILPCDTFPRFVVARRLSVCCCRSCMLTLPAVLPVWPRVLMLWLVPALLAVLSPPGHCTFVCSLSFRALVSQWSCVPCTYMSAVGCNFCTILEQRLYALCVCQNETCLHLYVTYI